MLSQGGFELNEIWARQRAALLEADVRGRTLERRLRTDPHDTSNRAEWAAHVRRTRDPADVMKIQHHDKIKELVRADRDLQRVQDDNDGEHYWKAQGARHKAWKDIHAAAKELLPPSRERKTWEAPDRATHEAAKKIVSDSIDRSYFPEEPDGDKAHRRTIARIHDHELHQPSTHDGREIYGGGNYASPDPVGLRSAFGHHGHLDKSDLKRVSHNPHARLSSHSYGLELTPKKDQS